MSLNSEKFNFTDFTRAHFRELIQIAKKEYTFITYDDIETSENKKTILWRHDVDFSMHSALKLAKIENEENVRATYFIWLQSKFYNTFEKEIVNIINEILFLGHSIGIHLDSETHKLNNKENIEKVLEFEKKILQELFSTEIKVFSFHNPTSEVLKNAHHTYAGLINTYSDYFKNQVDYCSDSNGYWRHKRLKDVLLSAQADKIQVLLHPEWWTEEILSPKEKIARAINLRAANNTNWYTTNLETHGRENIDW